jgi:enoyl-CoA hydratase/carnithine racemase
MDGFFAYQTLEVVLLKPSRTLAIYLKPCSHFDSDTEKESDHNKKSNQDSQVNKFSLEMLFELESLLAWASGRTEINSLIFASRQGKFSIGVDRNKLASYSLNQLEKFSVKLQKITHALRLMPQTVVMDLGEGAMNWALELSLGADIRIASEKVNVSFNHLELGLAPASGALSLISNSVSPGVLRSWILSGMNLSQTELLQSGFVTISYNDDNRNQLTEELLNRINSQSPVCRIQTKHGLAAFFDEKIQENRERESSIAKGAYQTGDWQKSNNFEKASDFKKRANLKLVPSSIQNGRNSRDREEGIDQ